MTERDVGTIVEPGPEDRKILEVLQGNIERMQQELGTLREEYLAKEALLTKGLGNCRAALHAKVTAVATVHQIDFASDDVCWKYHPDRLVFERVK